METKKDKILIVRISEKEDEIIKELRDTYSVNLSCLVREMIKKYYENRKNKKI